MASLPVMRPSAAVVAVAVLDTGSLEAATESRDAGERQCCPVACV